MTLFNFVIIEKKTLRLGFSKSWMIINLKYWKIRNLTKKWFNWNFNNFWRVSTSEPLTTTLAAIQTIKILPKVCTIGGVLYWFLNLKQILVTKEGVNVNKVWKTSSIIFRDKQNNKIVFEMYFYVPWFYSDSALNGHLLIFVLYSFFE